MSFTEKEWKGFFELFRAIACGDVAMELDTIKPKFPKYTTVARGYRKSKIAARRAWMLDARKHRDNPELRVICIDNARLASRASWQTFRGSR